MRATVDRKDLFNKLEEAYNDILIWDDKDDYELGKREGVALAINILNAMPDTIDLNTAQIVEGE